MILLHLSLLLTLLWWETLLLLGTKTELPQPFWHVQRLRTMDSQSNWPSERSLDISWRKIMESLELPASQTGTVVTVSLLHYPEPTDFPVDGGDASLHFCKFCRFASAGGWGPGAVNREEGVRESKKWLCIPWKRERDISTPRGVGLTGHMVGKDLCFSAFIGVDILD